MKTSRKINLTITLLLVTAMLLAGLTAAFADEESDKRKEADQAGARAQELFDQVGKAQQKIEGLQSNIENTQAEISAKEEELKSKKKEISKQSEALDSRLVAMYKTGTVGIVDVILGSDNINELITNVGMVQKILNGDKKLLESLRAEYEEIGKLQKELAAKENSLKADKAAVEKTKDALKGKADEYKQQSDQLNAEADELAAEAERRRIEAEEKLRAQKEAEERERAERERNSSGGSSGNSGSSGSSGSSGGNSGGAVSPAPSSGYMWPIKGNYVITSPFGYRIHPIFGYRLYHSGVDIGGKPTGTPVYSVADGYVTMASWYGGYGNCIQIAIGNGYTTLFGHLSGYAVSNGQYVRKGQVVGYLGSTGNSTGPHLHFTVFKNGALVDPYILY